ncbi:MAG: hypothetical protein EXS36_07900 [Pedosphaera sp.]|nr:hypothetical protein [Pedosphaera sp.]
MSLGNCGAAFRRSRHRSIIRERSTWCATAGCSTCVDAQDGTVRSQERLGVPGQYSASPVAADGRIYVASQSGTVIVLKAGGTAPEVVARNDLGESIVATPAFAESTILIRTAGNLYAFEQR